MPEIWVTATELSRELGVPLDKLAQLHFMGLIQGRQLARKDGKTCVLTQQYERGSAERALADEVARSLARR